MNNKVSSEAQIYQIISAPTGFNAFETSPTATRHNVLITAASMIAASSMFTPIAAKAARSRARRPPRFLSAKE